MTRWALDPYASASHARQQVADCPTNASPGSWAHELSAAQPSPMSLLLAMFVSLYTTQDRACPSQAASSNVIDRLLCACQPALRMSADRHSPILPPYDSQERPMMTVDRERS